MSRIVWVRKTVDAPPLDAVNEPDWTTLLDEIFQQGVPKKQVAERCEMTRQVLYSIWHGVSVPHWRQGQLLIALHKKVAPQQLPRVPMMSYLGKF